MQNKPKIGTKALDKMLHDEIVKHHLTKENIGTVLKKIFPVIKANACMNSFEERGEFLSDFILNALEDHLSNKVA